MSAVMRLVPVCGLCGHRYARMWDDDEQAVHMAAEHRLRFVRGDMRAGALPHWERMTEVIPAIGRIVHYVSYGTPGGEYPMACRAAVITQVLDSETGSVGLCVLNPTGHFFNPVVGRDDGRLDATTSARIRDLPRLCGRRYYAGASWHWPERLPE